MTKNGQAEIGIGVIVLLGVTIMGIFGTYESISDNRYVLDLDSNTVYDLTKCSITNLDSANMEYLRQGDLVGKSYTMAECSR